MIDNSISNAVGIRPLGAKGIRTQLVEWVREMSMSYTEKGQKGPEFAISLGRLFLFLLCNLLKNQCFAFCRKLLSMRFLGKQPFVFASKAHNALIYKRFDSSHLALHPSTRQENRG